MIKRILKTGGLLGVAGLAYWLILSFPIPSPFSKLIIIIMDLLLILLWGNLNYTSFLSSDNRPISFLVRLIELYTIPILVLMIGIAGSYLDIGILSMIFIVYFMPFVNILIVYLNNFINITSYFFAPFFVMLLISFVSLVFYKTKDSKKRYR